MIIYGDLHSLENTMDYHYVELGQQCRWPIMQGLTWPTGKKSLNCMKLQLAIRISKNR